MRPEGVLIAERALAQHSARLIKRPPQASELAAALGSVAARLEGALAEALTDLLGGKPKVVCGKPERSPAARLHKLVDPVAINCLFADAGGTQVVLAINHADALLLTDQVFGGAGAWSAPRPDRLPTSADLVIKRLAGAVGEAVAKACELAEPLQMTARSDVLGKFVSASDPREYLLLRAKVARASGTPGLGEWDMLLIVSNDHAAKLLDASGAPAAARDRGDRRHPDAAPFGSVAVPLTAVLAEMRVPVSRVSRLAPGDVLPLAISGQARLRAGHTEIARGQIGTSDGALALRLTRLAWNAKGPGNDG